jgi:hypothetical protein
MTFSVYQHWDPLRVCAVGRSYPPEFYSWIQVPRVRDLFERIAQETEEDYQNIIKTLEKFSVEILRPDEPSFEILPHGQYAPPPMVPRDRMIMVGDRFYENESWNWNNFYNDVRDASWPDYHTVDDFLSQAPDALIQEAIDLHGLHFWQQWRSPWQTIIDHIASCGNKIRSHCIDSRLINGAMITRLGRDLYFGTLSYDQDVTGIQPRLDREFSRTRNHIVNTGGHSDGTYCPVAPGLIISLRDIPTYAATFPGWEVVYLEREGWEKIPGFEHLKTKNRGRWWIPGSEYDPDVVETVESWMSHWVGYVEETVFDVNMLIIDPKNVIVFNENDLVFDALHRHGITAHVVPFRHRYFWDGGIHCVTLDLHRQGTMQNYFPDRD